MFKATPWKHSSNYVMKPSNNKWNIHHFTKNGRKFINLAHQNLFIFRKVNNQRFFDNIIEIIKKYCEFTDKQNIPVPTPLLKILKKNQLVKIVVLAHIERQRNWFQFLKDVIVFVVRTFNRNCRDTTEVRKNFMNYTNSATHWALRYRNVHG